MKKENFLTVQAFSMFVVGIFIGVLVILAVLFSQGLLGSNQGQTDLLRGEYGESIYFDRYSGEHLDEKGTVIPNFDTRSGNGGLDSSFYKDPSSDSYRDAYGTVIPNFHPVLERGYNYSYSYNSSRGNYVDAYGTVIPNFYPGR